MTAALEPSDAHLPTALVDLIQHAIDHSLAANTQLNYRSARRCFEKFCDVNNVPHKLRFPVNEEILCAFAASHAGLKSGSTAANHVAGLKAWHAMNSAPWPGDTRLIYVLRGVSNLTPATSKRAIRPPVTSAMLRMLHSDLDLDNPEDAAVFAVACVSFWAQCRLGEVVGSSRRNIFNPALPTIRSIGKRSSKNGSRELHLPRTKTNQRNGQTVILTRQDHDIDPIRAITHLIRVNKNPPSTANLFTFRSPNGELRALTKENFLARCNQIWSTHGLPRFTGHSFRAGGTSELLDMGVAPEIVKEMGRWKSDAFHRYWRGLGSIIARHTEYIHNRPAPAPQVINKRRSAHPLRARR